MEIEVQNLPEGGILVCISNIKSDPWLVKGIADAASCLAGMKFSRFFREGNNIRFRLRDGDDEEFWRRFTEYRDNLGLN